jgi:TolA-binding protein
MKWLLLLTISLGGCRAREAVYDQKASDAYRAAWAKKLNGDEAGYRAGLEQVKKQYPGTRAGERAAERLKK